jgi:hypothetical protein
MNTYEEPNSRGIDNFDYNNTYNPSYNYDQQQPYTGYNTNYQYNQPNTNYQYNQPNYSYDQPLSDNDSSIGTPPGQNNYYDPLNYIDNQNSTKTSPIEQSENSENVPFEPSPLYDPVDGLAEFPVEQNKPVEAEEKFVSIYFDNDPSDEFRPPPSKNKIPNQDTKTEDTSKAKPDEKRLIILDDDPSDEFRLPDNVVPAKTPQKLTEKPIGLNEETMSDLDENEIENDAHTPGLEWNRFKPIRPKSVTNDLEKSLSKNEMNFKAIEERSRKISSPKVIGKSAEEKLSPKDLSHSLEIKSILKTHTENSSPKSLDANETSLIDRKIKSPKIVSKKVPSEILAAKLKSQEELDAIKPKIALKSRILSSPKLIAKTVFKPEIVTVDQLSPKLSKLIVETPVSLKPILESESFEMKSNSLSPSEKPSDAKPVEPITKSDILVVKPISQNSTLKTNNQFKPISISPANQQESKNYLTVS